MKPALWFLLKFIALTVPLTWLWVTGGREVYGAILGPVSNFVYELFGAEGVKPVWRERYINYVPFVSLMLLTPKLGWKSRLRGLVIGLLLIFAAHIAMNWISFAIRGRGGFPKYLAVFSDALPFFLWAALAREFVGDVARQVIGTAPPPEGAAEAEAPGESRG
jgi:hypothetical protein